MEIIPSLPKNKTNKQKVPGSLAATGLGLKLSLPASEKPEEKQKGLATEAAVLIV